ncbi:hypothetical protein BH10ACI1_BH10ACI1_10390 [soil metagenome]
MQAVIDEIVEKVPSLTSKERRELIQLLQEEERKVEQNGGKGEVSPNTVWLRENRHKYGGMYVAIEDGKLVGQGKNFPEADKDAKKNGSRKPFITYVFPVDSKPFGGW